MRQFVDNVWKNDVISRSRNNELFDKIKVVRLILKSLIILWQELLFRIRQVQTDSEREVQARRQSRHFQRLDLSRVKVSVTK